LTVIDDYDKGELMRAAIRTLKKSFPHVQLLETRGREGVQTWDVANWRSVYVIYASRRKLDLNELWAAQPMIRPAADNPEVITSTVGLLGTPLGQGHLLASSALLPHPKTVALEPARLQGYIAGGRWQVILTDNYAPVDNLISGLFAY